MHYQKLQIYKLNKDLINLRGHPQNIFLSVLSVILLVIPCPTCHILSKTQLSRKLSAGPQFFYKLHH